MQAALPYSQRALSDIMPGQPVQRREIRGPADIHEPYIDPQGGVELGTQGSSRSP